MEKEILIGFAIWGAFAFIGYWLLKDDEHD